MMLVLFLVNMSASLMWHYNENPNTEGDEGPKYTYELDMKYNTNDKKVDEDQEMASVADMSVEP